MIPTSISIESQPLRATAGPLGRSRMSVNGWVA